MKHMSSLDLDFVDDNTKLRNSIDMITREK